MKFVVVVITFFTFSAMLYMCTSIENYTSSIAVVSREDGSGARSVFEELVNINRKEDSLMTQNAIVSNGNGVVANSIAENPNAIGYISWVT